MSNSGRGAEAQFQSSAIKIAETQQQVNAHHRGSYLFSHDELAALPISNIQDAIILAPGVYKARKGDEISVFGSRFGGTQYIVDGMR